MTNQTTKQRDEVNMVTGECNPVRCPESRRPFVRKPWCRERLKLINNEPSMTQQSHAESVDVNHIISRYDRTGLLPPATRQGFYGDVTGLQGDLTERWQASKQTINTAEKFAEGWIPPAETAPAPTGANEANVPPPPAQTTP